MYLFVDILQKCVIARLTDEEKAQELIASLGPRYGVIETEQVFAEKDILVPEGTAGVGVCDNTPDYGPLDSRDIPYEPFVVADVFDDYDVPASSIHCETARYKLVSDVSGFVRDVARVSVKENYEEAE